MRVLITGGAGFIGAHIATAYLARGDEVLIIDNLYTGLYDAVPAGAGFARVDITDAAALAAVFTRFRPELVSHHAAQMDVRRSVHEPSYDTEVNVLGSVNVMRNCVEVGVGRLVFASSGGAVYGEPVAIPTAEDSPIRPLSMYGAAKFCAEQYLATFKRLYGLEHTILRYANVYGPGQRPDGEAGVVAIFAGLMLDGRQPELFGAGDKTRDYVYIDDVVRAALLASDRGVTGPYNIGTGIRTSDREVFDAVAAAVGYRGEPIIGPERKGEVRHIALDCRKAEREFGWRPKIDFASGIAATVRHIRATHGG